MQPRPTPIPFDELLAHASWTRDLARSLVTDSNDADDAVQETWLSALRSGPSDRRNLRGWLARTLKNSVRQRARIDERRVRHESDHEREPVPTPDELAARLDMQRVLAEEVARLPEPMRATILLRFYEGRTPSEIARDMELPAGTVRWRLHEALARLRERLDARHGDRTSWAVALAPLFHDATKGGGLGAATWSAIVMMKLSTKFAIVAAVVLLVGGFATWRAIHASASGSESSARGFVAQQESHDALSDDTSTRDEREHRTAVGSSGAARVTIEGTVVDLAYPELGWAEKPAAGVRVECAEAREAGGIDKRVETTTDAQGHFSITPDPTASVLHMTAVADDDHRQASKLVDLITGQNMKNLRLERAAHGTLAGMIVDDRGAPLADVALEAKSAGSTLTARSAPDGSVRFDRFPETDNRTWSVVKPGYRAISPPFPAARTKGGWEPLRIVLVRASGKIELDVRDASGEPMGGVFAAVEVSSDEPAMRHAPHPDSFFTNPLRIEGAAMSDARGHVELANVWLNKKLAITIVDKKRKLRGASMRDGELSLFSESGDPIVMTDSLLEIRATLLEPTRLSGVVVEADGSVVAKPHIEISDRDTPDSVESMSTITFVGNRDGRFVRAYDATHWPLHLRITASDRPNEPAGAAPTSATSGIHAASAFVTLEASDAHAEHAIQLVLEPTFDIAGRVRDAHGSRGGVRINAVPTGTTVRYEPSRTAAADIANDGTFRLEGLAAGIYDLLVDQERETSFGWLTVAPLAQTRFTGIRAGTSDLDLTMPPPALVEVSVEAHPQDASMDQMVVLLGRLDRPSAHAHPARVTATEMLVRDHAGWPGPFRFSGLFTTRDDEGEATFIAIPHSGTTYTWPPLAEGRYWVGVCSKNQADSAQSYTEGTGWLDLRAGKYHFAFETVPTSTIEGRLKSDALDRRLCVELVDESGRAIRTQRDRSHIDTVQHIGADGSFSIDGAPIGRFTLRVGDESELRAGRFRLERPIEIAEKNEPLEITMP
jgi:RNA polymerase sigma-70 factor (ECF subfamily)